MIDFKWPKKIVAAMLIFLAGGNCFLNLCWIKYGIPTHWEGSWGKLALAVFFGIAFGYIAISEDN